MQLARKSKSVFLVSFFPNISHPFEDPEHIASSPDITWDCLRLAENSNLRSAFFRPSTRVVGIYLEGRKIIDLMESVSTRRCDFPTCSPIYLPAGHELTVSRKHFDGFSSLTLRWSIWSPINQSLVKWCFYKINKIFFVVFVAFSHHHRCKKEKCSLLLFLRSIKQFHNDLSERNNFLIHF